MLENKEKGLSSYLLSDNETALSANMSYLKLGHNHTKK